MRVHISACGPCQRYLISRYSSLAEGKADLAIEYHQTAGRPSKLSHDATVSLGEREQRAAAICAKSCSPDPLASGGTKRAFGINDHGQNVGNYIDASSVQHGFLATPVR